MKSRTDGTCSNCSSSDQLPLICVVCACIILLTSFYIFIDTRFSLTNNHMVLLIIICCGQLTTMNQTLAVAIKVGTIDWVNPLSPLMNAIRLLTFDVEIFQVGCVVTISPFQQYISKLMVPILIGAYIVVLHFFNVLLVRRRSICSRLSSLANTEGQIMMVFFISIISMVTEPLQCLQHPNGVWTMESSRSVQCWKGGEYTVMSATSIVMLLGALSFVALSIWVLLQYPAKMSVGDVTFLQTWSFMLFRFRPEARWCLLFFLGRSVMISILPTLPSAILQILLLQSVSLLNIVVSLKAHPWRLQLANNTELYGSIWLTVFMTLCALMFPEYSPAAVSTVALVTILISFLSLPATVGYSFCKRYCIKHTKRFQFFISHHKNGVGCLARLIKYYLELRPLRGAVFIDSDNLETLDALFDIVANQTKTLVALASARLLQRPWCVGEIASAVDARVSIYPIHCSDFVLPTPEYLNALEENVDFSTITSYGVGVDAAKCAIALFIDLPFAVLPDLLTDTIIHFVTENIINNTYDIDYTLPVSSTKTENSDPCLLVISDFSVREAAATALLLIAMLGHKIRAGNSNCTARLWRDFPEESKDALESPQFVRSIILLCSNQCWGSPQYLHSVLQCSRLGLPALPVIADGGCTYPSTDFYGSLELMIICLTQERGAPYRVGDLTLFVQQVFQSIAVRFDPRGDSLQLDKEANEVLRRSDNLWKLRQRSRPLSEIEPVFGL